MAWVQAPAADPLATPEWAENAELAATFAERHGQLFDVDAPVVEQDPELLAQQEEERKRKNRENAARRARGRSRRYCKANGLTRMWTLTFAAAVYDRATVVAALNALSSVLRSWYGEAFPYLWAIEEHESGALHVHLAAGRLVAMRCHRCDPDDERTGVHSLYDDRRRRRKQALPCLPCVWGGAHVHRGQAWEGGIVYAQRFRGQKGGGRRAAASVAHYVAKYIGKDVEACEPGQKSYDVARGFQPEALVYDFPEVAEALRAMSAVFFDGQAPGFVWDSSTVEDWPGPPVRVAFW